MMSLLVAVTFYSFELDCFYLNTEYISNRAKLLIIRTVN